MRTLTRSIVVRTLIVVIGLLLCASRVAAQTESVEYYGLDALGSVRVVFDASGNVTGRMDYGPFGESLVTGSGMPSRAYAGLFRDGEAGLDHAEARSYQSRTGRFTSIDPVSGSADRPQSWNRYSYSFNNPLAFTDSSGADPNPSTASTYQTVNCGLGAYWCPGAVRGANVDRYFDPNQYGYHGGEMAVAEAQYAAGVAAVFARGVVESFSHSRDTAQHGRGGVSTSTEIILPDKTKMRPGESVDPVVQIASGVRDRASALTDPTNYFEFYLLAAAGGTLGAVCAAQCLQAVKGGQTAAIWVEVRAPGLIDFVGDFVSTRLPGPYLVTTAGAVAGFGVDFFYQFLDPPITRLEQAMDRRLLGKK